MSLKSPPSSPLLSPVGKSDHYRHAKYYFSDGNAIFLVYVLFFSTLLLTKGMVVRSTAAYSIFTGTFCKLANIHSSLLCSLCQA
jgi:hypothetical protein